jgi:hypothetical protein
MRSVAADRSPGDGSLRQPSGDSAELSSITTHRSSTLLAKQAARTEELLGISSEEGEDLDEE